MTCIVGLKQNGKIYMGADSAGVGLYSISLHADQKVFVRKGFIFGFTSSFRMGQLLMHSFNPPQCHPDIDLHEYMVTSFIDGVRSCLKVGGFAKKENEVESGGCFLVGYSGRLFKIYDDYQVQEVLGDYNAAGCGNDIAFGVMYATAGKRPKDRIKLALEAAEHHNAAVRAPFIIKELTGSNHVV